MIKITDDSGRMLPAFRNIITLIFFIIGIVLGWFGHIVWNRQAEASQLVQDAKAMVDIRHDKEVRKQVLHENIEEAKQVEQTDCNCGDAADIEFQRRLRENRSEGFKFDGKSPF